MYNFIKNIKHKISASRMFLIAICIHKNGRSPFVYHLTFNELQRNVLNYIKEIVMPTIQKSLRLSEKAVKDIENLAQRTGKDFSGLARDLLVEAIKMRKCPGIIFSDGAFGRRARIAGSGIDVWELIAGYKSAKENLDELRKACDWLNDQQIRAALAYYTLFPEEIDELIAQNEMMNQEQVLDRFPFLKPPATKK
jgi:uncharacterized protein (DUF433 family)